MPAPFSKGDRVKCLATMRDLSDSDDEGGSSANNKPNKYSGAPASSACRNL